jgi:formate hydrogenlyase subunit 6/NADH:ubiquinone oxidoreductase subunit I
MKVLYPEQIADFFAALATGFELRLPVMLPDGTRSLGTLEDGPIALQGGALASKPTAAFFPQQSVVFTVADNVIQNNALPDRSLLVVGFTRRDLDCLRFIDRFFAAGWRDDLYFLQREHAVIAGVSGYCGPEGALLPLAGGGCDLEFVWDGSCWLVLPYSESGLSIAAGIANSVADESLQLISAASQLCVDGGDATIRQASELLRADRVPDSFWEEIGDRCIACTGCNLVCPTCSCFGVQDWRYRDVVERSRIWDSCQLAGFMREASGHNPMGSEALRSRRRIHHKLAADLERWGEISCFLCGRCDAVCPTGIGIVSVSREIVERFSTTNAE